MDIPALKAFVAVANTRSFSKAAEQLHLTQPAISKRVALLEAQMGVRLIDRIGRQILLTEAGTVLLPRATALIADFEDTRRSMSNLSGEVSGTLHLGISHHLGLHRLPPLLKTFTEHFPAVALDIEFLGSEIAYQRVQAGSLEMAMTTLSEDQVEKVKAHKVWNDPMHFVIALTHPLATKVQLTLSDLAQHGAILPELNTFTGTMTKALFDKNNLPLKVTMNTNYLETIKMMVSIGLGWSVLPETLIEPPLQKIKVDSLTITRSLGAIYHQERTLSNAASAFLKLVGSEPDKSDQKAEHTDQR